jgi:hypothetical protein
MVIKAELYWIDLAKVTYVQGIIIWSYKYFMFVLSLGEIKGGSIKVWLTILMDIFLSMKIKFWRK